MLAALGDDGSDEGVLRVTRSCVIPLSELEWRFTASGGPGAEAYRRLAADSPVASHIEFTGLVPQEQIEEFIESLQRGSRPTQSSLGVNRMAS